MIDIVKIVPDKLMLAYGKEFGFSSVIGSKNIVIKQGGSEQQNRGNVSDKNVDILMNPELKSYKDKLHYRNSGLNHILAKIATDNDVAIGFGFSYLLNSNNVERARIIGRMKQNVRICRKSKTKMVVCSYASSPQEMRGAKDLLAFARVLGMTGGEAKKALNWKRREKKVREL